MATDSIPLDLRELARDALSRDGRITDTHLGPRSTELGFITADGRAATLILVTKEIV